jgi:cephalosporin-C deacetylase-like acetyl esterase
VQMVANYAASRSDLDGSRIGIFGQGAGATIAGLAATVDSRIQVVDLLDPWGDWPDWIAKSKLVPDNERPEYQRPEYLKPLEHLDPIQWLPQLAGRPLKLDDALYETTTPPEAKAKIEAALPTASLLVRYPTPGDFEKNALADGKLVAWIQEQLLATHSGNATTADASAESRTASSDADSQTPAHN